MLICIRQRAYSTISSPSGVDTSRPKERIRIALSTLSSSCAAPRKRDAAGTPRYWAYLQTSTGSLTFERAYFRNAVRVVRASRRCCRAHVQAIEISHSSGSLHEFTEERLGLCIYTVPQRTRNKNYWYSFYNIPDKNANDVAHKSSWRQKIKNCIQPSWRATLRWL